MMESIFTYRDNKEGKVGIGKLPENMNTLLENILNTYNNLIPDKESSTHHMWYADMPENLKKMIGKIKENEIWNKICDNSEKCIKISVSEMDELYYSNPKNNVVKKNIGNENSYGNLYGAAGNYKIHRDCIFNFNGIRFYRVLIGLTDKNDNVVTYFNNLKIGHKINSGDYVIFDFDKTTHQVYKEKETNTPRILLKLHYIICENCKYSKEYVESVKHMYIYYEYITRYIMQTGTDPETLYQFFFGVINDIYTGENFTYILWLVIMLILLMLIYIFGINLEKTDVFLTIGYVLISLLSLYIIIVLYFWLRYKLFNIR